jgi:O-antigen biosynthesis protein
MKLSVIIPCHNAGSFVAQTIGSVLEQSRRPDEIIVVDDRSTDDSVRIVRRFGPRVSLVRADFGVAGKARNLGAALSTGDALMFLDADDVLAPETLEALERTLTRAPGGVTVGPWSRLELDQGRWVRRGASVPSARWPRDMLAGWLQGYFYPPCAVLWSRQAFERAGGWLEEYNPNDDGDLMMRALLEKIPVVRSAAGHSFYRRVPDNASLSGQRASERGLKARVEVLEKVRAWLEERQAVDVYRLPLASALAGLRQEAAGAGLREWEAYLSEQYKHCCSTVRLDRPRLQARDLQRGVRQQWGRWRRAIGRRLQISGGAEEIRHGQRMAAEVERSVTSDGATELFPPTRPLVSVVIPTYNRSGLVCRAVRSVLAQTFDDFEVLVVDDASTDDTAEAVQGLGDRRVRYLRQPYNQDVSAARNRGLREARGDFIAFLDSDDEWLPQKLERQLGVFRAAPPKVGLVYTGSLSIQPDGTVQKLRPKHRGAVLDRLLLTNLTCSGSGTVMIRREVVRKVGFFDETIAAMEDYDYWIRVARFYDFDYVPEPLVRYYDVPMADRRSLVADADRRARDRLYQKFRPELERRGLLVDFLIISVGRRLYWFDAVDRAGAAKLALQAVAARPWAVGPYRAVLRTLLPLRLHRSRRQPRGQPREDLHPV